MTSASDPPFLVAGQGGEPREQGRASLQQRDHFNKMGFSVVWESLGNTSKTGNR